MSRPASLREAVELASGIVKYLLLMSGVLVAALLLLLASTSQMANTPPAVSNALMILLLFPLLMDLMLVSPQLPSVLSMLLAVPLALVLIVVLRILLSGRGSAGGGVRAVQRAKRYPLPTLLAVSIGATLGPSAFVLTPYSVKVYGWLAVPGIALASLTSIALAYGYSRMHEYVKSGGGSAVGGPSFVRSAFGAGHYLYMASRFAMWIGNVSLAAFNMLVVINFVVGYVMPRLPGLEPVAPLVKAGLFIALTGVVLLVYRGWESAVGVQAYLTMLFLALFLTHLAMMASSHVELPQAHDVASPGPWDPLTGILSSAALVYMMVFGFQEVQSLGENVEASSELEACRALRLAMVGGAAATAAILCTYASLYALMGPSKIPGTWIPALDLASSSAPLYAATSLALMLGVATTYVPAFVAALKHLDELVSDTLNVRPRAGLNPILVIAFMGALLLTNADYIIQLTDLAVLLSLVIVAASEPRLRRKSGVKGLLGDVRAYANAAVMSIIVATFALTHWALTANCLLFMLLSTLSLMLISYDLLVVEAFTIITGLVSLLLTPSLSGVIRALASYKLVSPLTVTMEQASTISLFTLHFTLVILIMHMLLRYREPVERVARWAAERVSRVLRRIGG